MLVSSKARLLRGVKHSILYRIPDSGEADLIEINHAAMTWKVSAPGAAVETLSASTERIKGIKTKVQRRDGVPDRDIDGYKTKGSGADIWFDPSELIRDQALGPDGKEMRGRAVAVVQGTRFSFDTWVTRELEALMRQFLGRAEGGAEALALVNELGEGFAMETVMRMEVPMMAGMKPDGTKPMLVRVSAKNIEKGEIAEKEFAIPEG